jgi:3-methylcrotonyl-CoA carboxylase beta subunit
MSGESAADTLAQIKAKQMECDGTQLSEKELGDLRKSVLATYEEQTNPHYAASRLWTDAILDPARTREALIHALDAAALNTEIAEFKTGVLQT